MYIIKNALKSIVRSKGRNILIGFIVIIIAVAGCVALSINNSASEVVKGQEKSQTVTATLSVDRQQIKQDARKSGTDIKEAAGSIPTLTIDDINKYGTSNYLKDYYYLLSSSMNSDISPYTSDTSSSGNNDNSTGNSSFPGGQGGRNGFVRGDFTISGYSSTSAMSDFLSGTSKITQGKIFDFNDNYNCIISSDLATVNSLKTGDKITLNNPSNEKETYEFTISGIYENKTAGSIENQFVSSPSADPANRIIMSYQALNKVVKASEALNPASTQEQANTQDLSAAAATVSAVRGQVSSTFVLKDASGVDGFKADLQAMGINKYFNVVTNQSAVENSLKPIKNLSSFAGIFLLIVLAVGGVILVVINFINIRERKYEVGVLTAIGMKKSKVALQFVTEIFIVTFAAIIIGTSAGAALSVPVANTMLQSQITAQENQQTEQNKNFGLPGDNSGFRNDRQSFGNRTGNFFGMADRQNISYVEQINAVINGNVLLQLLGIGFLLTLISSGAAIIFISRYSPLKILNERS